MEGSAQREWERRGVVAGVDREEGEGPCCVIVLLISSDHPKGDPSYKDEGKDSHPGLSEMSPLVQALSHLLLILHPYLRPLLAVR